MPQFAHIEVGLENPLNAGVIKHLRNGQSLSVARNWPACSPETIDDAYTTLGTHPDLVARLWDEITISLPIRCRWVVFGAPVLVRPDSGIIFAFAGGTHTYALRLPANEREELAAAALQQGKERADKFCLRGRDRDKYLRGQSGNIHEYSDGSSFDIASVGKEWVFGRWLKDEIRWCLSAYEYSA